MKKKLIIAMLINLLFSLSIITVLFIVIVKYQHIERTKTMLNLTTNVVINLIQDENEDKRESILSKVADDHTVNLIYLNKDKKVKFNSLKNDYDLAFFKEITNNINKGPHIVNNSINMRDEGTFIYNIKNIKDGSIVISVMEMKNFLALDGKYLEYYIIVLIITIIVALIFSSKLSLLIINPIANLEFITSRIAKGELDRRVKVESKDEIGHLAITFNNMADRLQGTINDVIDNQNKLQAILKSMDSGVIAVDQENKIIMINPCAKSIFCINRNIIGENADNNIGYINLNKIFHPYEGDYNEIKIYCPKEKYLRIKIADIINGYEKIGKVAVIQDVTNVKKLESMRTQFVANVSHELKTPLTSIKGFAETLKYVDDEDTKNKFLNIINDESERLSRLISDILVLSSIESEHNEDKKEDINVNSLIEDIYYLVKKEADNKKIKLEIKGDKVPILKGDKDRFKQMIINLVDNAIKYSDENSLVEVFTNYDNNNLILRVRDRGIGIPKEDIDRIFERFYRVDKGRSRSQGGTGLGLAIVKHIVLNFNGTINVESELGKGSTFDVIIPY